MSDLIIWGAFIGLAIMLGLFFFNIILMAVIYIFVGAASLIGYAFGQFKEFFTRKA